MIKSGTATRLGLSLVGVVVVAATGSARADQCEVVKKKQADQAADVLRTGSTDFVKYCEPCKDAPPSSGSPLKIQINPKLPPKQNRAVEVRAAAGGYSVHVNGEAVDLAYTYYHQSSGGNLSNGYTDYANLAKLVGCATRNVSDSVRIQGLVNGTRVAPGQINVPATDPTLLAGTWTVTTSTELSTCVTDPSGSKSSFVWTLSALNGKIKIKSNSGAEFTGLVDTGSRSVVVVAASAPSSVLTQLMMQDAKTLSGRQVYAQATKNAADPMCTAYRTLTATKQ